MPVCIRPAELSLDNNDSGTRDNAAEQQITSFRFRAGAASAKTRRGSNPFDGPDSRPNTPRTARNDIGLLPPKLVSARKGISTIGISRPAEVKEEDWKRMSGIEQRRVWHFRRINSETFGQRAPQPCQQCMERRDNSRKTSECRIYKDVHNRVQQCAVCLFSRKGCSFAQKASIAEVPRGEAQLIARVGKNIIDAPLVSQAQPSPWDAVIWVMFPDNQPFYESTTLFIQNSPDDLSRLGYNAWLWFNKAVESGLGDSAVLDEEDGICVHQGLLTMLAMQYGVRSEKSLSVRFHKWGWLKG